MSRKEFKDNVPHSERGMDFDNMGIYVLTSRIDRTMERVPRTGVGRKSIALYEVLWKSLIGGSYRHTVPVRRLL
jgi:hypothetical protein